MTVLAKVVNDAVISKYEIGLHGLTIGRSRESDVVLEGHGVDACHCRFIQEPNPDFAEFVETYIDDIDGGNPTYVNGVTISGKYKLRHDDQIRVGEHHFVFYAAKIEIKDSLSNSADIARDM